MPKLAGLNDVVDFLKIAEEKGLTAEAARLMKSSGALADMCEAGNAGTLCDEKRNEWRLALGLHRIKPCPKLTRLWTVMIPCDATVGSMVRAGQYVKEPSFINDAYFCISHVGARNLLTCDLQMPIRPNDARRYIESELPHHGIAGIDDLLAVGADPNCRKIYEEVPIACLGSPLPLCDGEGANSTFFQILDTHAGMRSLQLIESDRTLYECQFLITIQDNLVRS